ncbi:DeoR/GlpR transcriptional regulator [Nakamurella antarctica]|uniref:DeoR/GlpR transcriptional regulator n=1 Tax=Nakamurella antarctica TaxID=1902245 RepID=A0A3G9A065_9ACTN|nr:DeoR/GlpR family DNA-binding transcription regulator [Nakamurella antarctica]AZI59171.1 DeoR/GlpR transcriptional regulator [Nakamurella antarctica]
MLAQMRQARILEEVHRSGGVRVSNLTDILGVSDMTIRRDLELMARKGLLAKVHGGATAVDTASAVEPGFAAKSGRETAEKQAIAARAASLVRPGMAVAITAGTTTWTLATHLAAIASLTVVTNSLKVAEVLYAQGRPDLTVVLTGGIRTPSDGLVGPIAVHAIKSLHVDMVIMGVHGIDERAGLTTPNLLEAETNRAFVDSARRLVVIADNTKWGVVGLSQIAPLDAVTTLVTDDRLDAHAVRVLQERVGEVICVPRVDAGRPFSASELDSHHHGGANGEPAYRVH